VEKEEGNGCNNTRVVGNVGSFTAKFLDEVPRIKIIGVSGCFGVSLATRMGSIFLY
jgi:hypothetical protein